MYSFIAPNFYHTKAYKFALNGTKRIKNSCNSPRVKTFENPAKGRPQTSSLRSAVIRQKVNKMAARKKL